MTNRISSNPSLGGCTVYIPSGSPLKGAAGDGQDVGANVVYRYLDGQLTTAKLWDPLNGQFPCGERIEGVNDDASFPQASCVNVHKRLNVGGGGCAIP
ncbi:MAG: hypothetical protein NVS3B20_00280 [Polyangiales bacterium]